MSLIRPTRVLLCPAVLFLLTTSGLTSQVSAQGLLPFDRDLAEEMLVLSRAAEIAGVQRDAAKAGTFFPKKWRN